MYFEVEFEWEFGKESRAVFQSRARTSEETYKEFA